MADTDLRDARKTMIRSQLSPSKVTDERVLAAFGAIPREQYLPKSLRAVAYVDEDLEVAPGRYVMEPLVMARLVQAAEIKPSNVVLEIGGAGGYAAAILAELAGTVISLEFDEALAAKATKNLEACGVSNAAVVVGELASGYAKESPFDVIVFSGAIEEIPQALIDQLSDGGRMVGVRSSSGVGRGFVAEKSGNAFGDREFMDAQVPPLPGFQKVNQFVF